MPAIHKFIYVNKWLTNIDLHQFWSNNFWTSPTLANAQLSQLLKFRYGQCMGNYWKHTILKHNISPECLLFLLSQNDTWLHLLAISTNPHIVNVCTNRHNIAIHAIISTLKGHPSTRCYILYHASIHDTCHPYSIVPSWLLPCSCYTNRCIHWPNYSLTFSMS